jgi:hypothetical protein
MPQTWQRCNIFLQNISLPVFVATAAIAADRKTEPTNPMNPFLRPCTATRFLSLLLLGSSACHPEAATIHWNMNSQSPAGTLPGGLTVSTLSRGNNNGTTTLLSTTSASSGYSFVVDGTTTPASGTSNAAAAARTGPLDLALSAYFEFTLTTSAGYTAEIAALGLATRRTSTGPTKVSLRSSADNFANSLATFTSEAASTWTHSTATLAPPFYLADAATITFRLYGYDGTGSASANTANWRIDDLILEASTAALAPEPSPVPEPANATVPLAAAAAVGLSRRQRYAPKRKPRPDSPSGRGSLIA